MHDITIADGTGVVSPANEITLDLRPPCPRTVHVDGTLDAGGACYGCGACLFAVLEPWA
jgi:hypothetical protein